MTISRRLLFVVCLLMLGKVFAHEAVDFPHPGYERFEVPIFWKETNKRKSMANAKNKGLPFLPMKKPVRALQRDRIFELELPGAPKSGDLYVSIEYSGKPSSVRDENSIMQVFGATFSYSVEEVLNDPRFASKTSFYAYHESEDPNEGYWVKGSTRSYMKSPPKTTSSGRPLPESLVNRLKSSQRVQLKIDFDDQSWSFYPSRDGSFPLSGNLERPVIFLAKNEQDPINVSKLTFSEQPLGRVIRRDSNSSSKEGVASPPGSPYRSREERIEQAKKALQERLESGQ